MTRILRQGHRGPDVLRWQQFLLSQGFSPGALDGAFGSKTAEATRAFQAKHGLKPDAAVGPQTFSKAASLGLRSLRRLTNAELTSALVDEARRILAENHASPYGTEVPFQVDGVRYVGRIEEHYHPPGGPRRPWGYHPGVSLFLSYHVPENDLPLPDDRVDAAPEGPPTEEALPIEATGIIVLDPGHGGTLMLGGSSPNNATSPSGVKEKDLVLVMAELIRDAIITKQPQVRVELTRTTDVNVSLFERARLARDVRADVFVSLHFNAFNGSARGVETFVRPKAAGNVNYDADHRFARRMVEAVYKSIHALDSGTRNRGVKEQAWGVLRDDWLGNTVANQPCPACLLEIEFLDVPVVDELFNTGPEAEEARSKVAEAIAEALLKEVFPPVAPTEGQDEQAEERSEEALVS